jgi:hypothetical protein
MAVRVKYFENTRDCYSEGPFVMVNACGWRVEVDYSQGCPALPDNSIYYFIRENGLPDGKHEEALCASIVDFLNAKVKDGTLIKDPKYGLTWIWEPYEQIMEMKRWEEKRAKMERENMV